jgi:biotin carboxyl carrier protein
VVGLLLVGGAAFVVVGDGEERDAPPDVAQIEGGGADDGGPATAVVRRDDLSASLQLRGSVLRRSTAITLPEQGELSTVVDPGTAVQAGQPVLHVEPPADAVTEAERRVEDARLALSSAEAPGAESDPAAVAAAELELDRAREDLATLEGTARDLVAPAAGTLIATTGGYEVQQGLAVRADVPALALLRLRSGELSGEAEVETVGGPERAACSALDVREAEGDAAASPSAGEGAAGSEAAVAGTVECGLEAGIETVAGLPAVLSVTAVLGEDVLMVPELAVGHDDDGAPFVELLDGTRQPIRLGPSDGVLRIVGGIDPGVEVRVDPDDADADADADDPGDGS